MKRTKMLVAVVIAVAALMLLGGAVFYQAEARAEISPVARGHELAAASGCFACHGPTEEDRRPNQRQLANGTWRAKPIPTLWENGIDEASVLKDWIANGVPADEAESHKRLFIQMPAYRDFLTEEEIDSVSVWILAEGIRLVRSGAENMADGGEMKTDIQRWSADEIWREGDRLSRQHGCYACHGELGQGAVRNPASFKGYIPGFFGKDFLALTEGGKREEILHWIDHGRGQAIESGVMGRWAKRYFDGQAIGMPAYRDRMNDSEKQVLVEFLLALQREGPLDAQKLERAAKRLTEPDSE